MGETNSCAVCQNPCHRFAALCKRCKKWVDRLDTRRKANKPARIKALKQAWDGRGFRCYYTGVKLNESDHRSPLYLTFDHRIPRQQEDIVVAAACMNDMKSDLTEKEFRRMVLELARHFEGGQFDKRAFDLEHWRR